jgi:ubiquinone biosynthesis protein
VQTITDGTDRRPPDARDRHRQVVEVVSTRRPARPRGGRDRVPTPLVDEHERRAIEILPLRGVGRFGTLRLALRIVAFAVGVAARRLTRRSTPATTAERTRMFLEDLGGLWVKAGQIISLRSDLLSVEMADELSRLTHRAHGFPPVVSRQVIEDSLGVPIEQVFSSYEEHPFAAASISQVHRARRRSDGALVAIKVQRPDIDGVFERDLKLIHVLIRLVKRVPQSSHVNWDETFREMQRIMREEVDYRYEVSNLYRIRKTLKKHGVVVPKVDRRLSNGRIIVMEFIDGVLMSDYSSVLKRDPDRAQRWREENNVDPKKVGSRLMRSFYRQLFEDNLFHGDLHPGNILLLRDSRFALIDFGTIGSVEQKLLDYYRLMSQSFNEGDYSKAMDYFLLQCDSVPVIDIAAFKAEAVEKYRNWEVRSNLLGLTYYERSITGGVAVEFAQMTQRYKVAPSHQFLRVTRSVGTIDANLGLLLDDSDPNKIMRRYFKEYRRRELRRLRKDASTKAVKGLNEVRMTTAFASEAIRQNAIKVNGLRRKVDELAKGLLGAARFVLAVGFVVLVYDYFHHHHPKSLDGFDARFEFLEAVAERIPGYHPEWALIFAVFTLYLLRKLGKAKRRYAQPMVTLPNGRMGADG